MLVTSVLKVDGLRVRVTDDSGEVATPLLQVSLSRLGAGADVLDGWHASVACSFTKHMAVMHAFDSVSTYGYCLTAAGHGFEEVTRFAEAVVRREAALEPPHAGWRQPLM